VRGCLQKAKTAKRGLRPGEASWNIILALGRGADGKHKQKWVRFHGTRKQAEEKLTELTGEVHRGEFVEPSKITVGAWLDEWLEKAIRPPRCTQNTFSAYNYIVTKHLKPGLGHVLLQKLTPLQVERYYAERGADLAERSVALHHAILTGALSAAVNNGTLRQNVASRVTNKPKVRQNDEDLLNNVWTADEARRFLESLKEDSSTQYLVLFALALETGLRKSELLGLQWKDIDGTSLRVDRQLLGVTEDEATGVFRLVTSPPKGKRSRALDLSDEVVTMLRDHKREQSEVKMKNRRHYVDHGLVFAQAWEHKSGKHSVLGMPLNKTMVGGQLAKLCRLSGVKRITVHGLRHTSATLLLSAGVQPHVVQRRLGHSKVEMTLNIYSHVLPSMQSDAASRLATVLHR
jgi:integrase